MYISMMHMYSMKLYIQENTLQGSSQYYGGFNFNTQEQ